VEKQKTNSQLHGQIEELNHDLQKAEQMLAAETAAMTLLQMMSS
jgi:hypothetical protein